MQCRDGDYTYWHGFSASRFLRNAVGQALCVGVPIVDGFIMKRSAFGCTLNCRSAVIFGTAFKILDPAERERQLAQFIYHGGDISWGSPWRGRVHEGLRRRFGSCAACLGFVGARHQFAGR